MPPRPFRPPHLRWTAVRLLLLSVALIGVPASAQPPVRAPWVLYDWDAPRCTAPTVEMARLIQDCMGRVMFPRGEASGRTPEVDVQSAALLCRHTRGTDQSRALAGCVRAVLYERSGLGRRREEVPPQAAATACRYATSQPLADSVEDCMLRQLFSRSGLGYQRTEMSPSAAASLCQGVAGAPVPWPFTPQCRPPLGDEAVRFTEECVKRLLHEREGLGPRRPDVTPEAAALACSGPLSPWP